MNPILLKIFKHTRCMLKCVLAYFYSFAVLIGIIFLIFVSSEPMSEIATLWESQQQVFFAINLFVLVVLLLTTAISHIRQNEGINEELFTEIVISFLTWGTVKFYGKQGTTPFEDINIEVMFWVFTSVLVAKIVLDKVYEYEKKKTAQKRYYWKVLVTDIKSCEEVEVTKGIRLYKVICSCQIDRTEKVEQGVCRIFSRLEYECIKNFGYYYIEGFEA